MTQETSPSVPPQKPSAGQPPIMPDKLAKWAYRLACLGPLSLLVIGMAYPPTDYRALPALPIQILWWALVIISPVGLVLGGVSLFLIRSSPIPMGGRNYAVAAIIVGFLVSACLPFGTSMLNGMRRMNRWRVSSCISNVKQLSMSMNMYAQDYDECYPVAASWNEATMPYIKNQTCYRCPNAEDLTLPSYAMNRHLQSVKTSTVGDSTRTVLLFDSVPGSDRAGGLGLLPAPVRHNGVHVIGFVDGHVKLIPVAEIGTLLWTLETGVLTKKKKAAHEVH